MSRLTADVERSRGYLPAVGKGLVSVVGEEDVLGFEVRMDEVEVVED